MAEITQMQALKNDLMAMKEKFEALLKSDTDKFLQIAVNYVEQNQKLLEANRASLYSAILKSAQCHLFIDGQEASLVPFKGNVTMMTGYKGILKMVRNSGELASINAGVVYENDVFEYFIDEQGEHLKHVPKMVTIKERGKPINTYCIARTKGNTEPYIEVMMEEEVEACKKQSASVKGGYDTPWNGPFADEMRKKTVIRRISKRLPMSTDLNQALNSDEELFNATVDDAPQVEEPVKTTSDKLANATQAAKPAPAPTPTPAPTPAPAPAPAQKPEAKEQGHMIEGVIAELKVLNVKVNNEPANRFACRIGDSWYGTFDQVIYKQMESAADKKVNTRIVYFKRVNKDGKPYQEAIDIKEFPVPADDVVI